MKEMPEFDPYPDARGPRYGWWLASLAVLLVLLDRFLPWTGYGLLVSVPIAIAILGPWLVAFLITALVQHSYRRDALRYADTVKQRQLDWQVRHWQKAALAGGVLIGDVASSSEDRQALLEPCHQQIKPKQTPDWIAINFEPVSGIDADERERQLAMLLAMRWYEQQAKPVVFQPLSCYWLGSLAAWEAFVEQMAKTCPEVRLPAQPEPWQGIDSLYAIIAQLQDAPADARILCAGCHSSAIRRGHCLPAGEAALLWLLGPQGRLLFSRGEWLFTDVEGVTSATKRARQQDERTARAQILVSLDEPDIPNPFETGWSSTQSLLAVGYDTLEDLSDMIALTLAAWHSERHGKPYSWLATYPHYTPILGVIKPNDPTESPKPNTPEAP